MEYIFGLTDGKRAIIYDEGNQIILLFISRGKITNYVIVEREYHSKLHAITYNNKIFLSYITVSNAIAWLELGGASRMILYADNSGRCHIMDLKASIINGRLALFYKSELEDKKLWRLQYIFPLEDRKSYLLHESKQDVTYSIAELANRLILTVCCEACEADYYIEENVNHRYVLIGMKMLNTEEQERYKKRYQEEQEHLNIRIEEEQEKLQQQFKLEREQLKKEFEKQYNELVEFTKQLQTEGKHWREMYYRNVQNKPKNT